MRPVDRACELADSLIQTVATETGLELLSSIELAAGVSLFLEKLRRLSPDVTSVLDYAVADVLTTPAGA